MILQYLTITNIIIALLVILLCICIFIINNMLKKIETYEENNITIFEENKKVWEYIVVMQKQVQDAITKMEIIDKSGAFAVEDEVGYVFKRLASVLTNLKTFIDGEERQ